MSKAVIKHNDAELASEAAFASFDSISEDGGVVSLIRLATDGKLIDRTSCASLYHSRVGRVKGFLSQLYRNFGGRARLYALSLLNQVIYDDVCVGAQLILRKICAPALWCTPEIRKFGTLCLMQRVTKTCRR